MSTSPPTTLVIGGNGTTGSRVVAGLERLGAPTRVGSRRGTPPFDWHDARTWSPALDGVDRVYIAHPATMGQEAIDEIGAFAKHAVEAGASRLVLLSGYGAEDITGPAENAVESSGAEWTFVRPSWFNQNFDAGDDYMFGFREAILSGNLVGNHGQARLGFVDADDIAAVAVAALTGDEHVGQSYDLTGPQLLTFAEAVAHIARATGRDITYTHLEPVDYREYLIAQGIPAEDADWMADMALTDDILADGVQRVLGRAATDFADYARRTAATGVWTP
ncbi:NAD(P)H-binding protein [Nocardia sp. NPDC055321]